MSIHLVGGGLFAASDAAAPFLAEATARSAAVGRSVPRIALLSVAGPDGGSPSSTADIAEVLGGPRTAEVLVTEVADTLVTDGAAGVENDSTAPTLLPSEFSAMAQK